MSFKCPQIVCSVCERVSNSIKRERERKTYTKCISIMSEYPLNKIEEVESERPQRTYKVWNVYRAYKV